MAYVDGFVLPLPKKNLKAYIRSQHEVGRRVPSNAKVMKDMMEIAPKDMPFDVKRMVYGGSKVVVG